MSEFLMALGAFLIIYTIAIIVSQFVPERDEEDSPDSSK